MIRVIVSRPNTIGITFEQDYETYTEAEEFIELQCERFANQGWSLSEDKSASSYQGSIEAVHDNIADSIIINWFTIVEKDAKETFERIGA